MSSVFSGSSGHFMQNHRMEESHTNDNTIGTKLIRELMSSTAQRQNSTESPYVHSVSPGPQRATVQHNYSDHACDPVCGDAADPDVFSSFSDTDSKKTAVPRFPQLLYQMLTAVDADGLSHIVSWQPHGRCFVVHKPKDFVEKVMPKYFRQSKMTSFQRQLNLYGFNRLTVGTDRGGYYHELFLCGRPDLSKRIARIRIKGTGIKPAPSPDTEPNFYAMQSCSAKMAEPATVRPNTSTAAGSSSASNPGGMHFSSMAQALQPFLNQNSDVSHSDQTGSHRAAFFGQSNGHSDTVDASLMEGQFAEVDQDTLEAYENSVFRKPLNEEAINKALLRLLVASVPAQPRAEG